MGSEIVTGEDGKRYRIDNIPDDSDPKTIMEFAEKQLGQPVTISDNWSDLPGNILPSAWQQAKDFGNMLMNPYDTAVGVKNLASGVARKFPPLEPITMATDYLGMTSPEDEQTADAVGGYLEERFTNPKRTMINDPVGAFSDVAGVISGGSTLIPKVGKFGQIAETAGKIAGDYGDLPGIMMKGVSKFSPSAEGTYQSAAKFPTTMKRDQRDRITKTALDEDINLSYKGADKLEGAVDESMATVKGALTEATEAGATIRTDDLLRSAREYRDSLDPLTAGDDYQKIYNQVNNVIKNQEEVWKNVETLTPEQVQTFKQSLDPKIKYSRAAKTFGGNFQPGTESARVNIRSDAKHALEQLDPKIKEANARAGRLLELKEQGHERAVNRIENRDIIGLGPAATMIPAQMIGGPAGAAIGGAASFGMRPKSQGQIALWMNQLRNSPLADKYFDAQGALTDAGRVALLEIEKSGEREKEETRGRLQQ